MDAPLMTELHLLPSERFHRAVINNDLQTAQRLWKMNKITNVRNKDADENGWTSLMVAARYGHLEIARFLLDVGHENESISTDSTGNTIPMISARYKHEDVCLEYLERYPHTLSKINRDGSSAINEAAQNGLNRVIDLILINGGNVNQRDIDGNTPLHHAASWDQYSTVALLLERGAQPTLKNHKGYTAIDYAYSFDMERHIRDTIKRVQLLTNQTPQPRPSTSQQPKMTL